MYGNGVSDEDIFMSRLSRRLNSAYPDANWQVINTAVGGYNTVMELETLKEKGLAYQPDIVIVFFVGNDLSLPNFIRQRVSFFARKSFLLEWVRERTTNIAHSKLVPAPLSDEGNWFERDPDKVPEAYRDMVGLDAYQKAMAELAALSRAHGFDVIVLQKHRREYVVRICAELELPHISFMPVLDEYMEEHGINLYTGSVLSVSENDPHPSALTHGLFTDVIIDY